ncbi:MAG TPA: hypothetical protein VK540_13940 [Polyangiaceae bacterium]|nr:hypothetical protein [Polyangiaceae bacterium]
MKRERKPKASNGAGNVEWRNGRPFARITLPDGRRKRIPIPEAYTTPERRQEFAASFAERVREGKITFDQTTHRKIGQAVTTVRDVMKA